MTTPYLLTLSLLLLGTGSAHADYRSSEPARGAVLETSPAQVVLDFTEPVEVRFSLFKVYALDTTGSDAPDDEGAGAAESHDHHEADHHEAEHDEADVGAHAHAVEGGETPASAVTLDAGDLLRLNGRAGLLVADVIALRGDEDARADAGLATTDARTARVVLELKPDLAPGAYVVMWRVLAADTHTTQGFYVFQITPSP